MNGVKEMLLVKEKKLVNEQFIVNKKSHILKILTKSITTNAKPRDQLFKMMNHKTDYTNIDGKNNKQKQCTVTENYNRQQNGLGRTYKQPHSSGFIDLSRFNS